MEDGGTSEKRIEDTNDISIDNDNDLDNANNNNSIIENITIKHINSENVAYASEKSPIIIDNGSGYIKAGFEHDTTPSVIFPTVVGQPRKRYEHEYEPDYICVGEEMMLYKHHMSQTQPIDHGHIENWEDMNLVWNHTFKKLQADPREHAILLTAPVLCSAHHREKMAQTFFEVYGAPEIQIAVSGLLTVFGCGKQTAFVVDIGDGVTQCIPVVEGHLQTHACKRSDFAGQELTMYTQKILCDIGYPLTGRDDFEYCRQIKEMHCFVSADPNTDIERTDLDCSYILPDGQMLRDNTTNDIALGVERFFAAEALFNPQLCTRDNESLTDLLWHSILACPLETRRELIKNVVLAGGTCAMTGFSERLQIELQHTAPVKARDDVNITCPDNVAVLPWIGGRILCSPSIKALSQQKWITRQEYEEFGNSIVHKKLYM